MISCAGGLRGGWWIFSIRKFGGMEGFGMFRLVRGGLCMAKPDMTTREEAAEQLKVIRSMMERATIFRALSGETALVGGAAALGAAWLSDGHRGWTWAWWWLGGLGLVIGFNVFQILRVGRAEGRPFWSMSLRMALRGALPSIIAGGFLGLLYVRSHMPNGDLLAACMWVLHYGLALLAIREFAPRSMVWLGWSFVVLGVLSLAGAAGVYEPLTAWLRQLNASHLMAIAFGGFHLIYGAVIVTTGKQEGR